MKNGGSLWKLRNSSRAREVATNDRLAGCAVRKDSGVLYGPKNSRGSFGTYKREFSSRVAGPKVRFGPAESGSAALAAKVALVKGDAIPPDHGDVIHTDFTNRPYGRFSACALHFVARVGVVRVESSPIVREIEVECLPGHTRNFSTSKSAADIDAVHIEDLQMPVDILYL